MIFKKEQKSLLSCLEFFEYRLRSSIISSLHFSHSFLLVCFPLNILLVFASRDFIWRYLSLRAQFEIIENYTPPPLCSFPNWWNIKIAKISIISWCSCFLFKIADKFIHNNMIYTSVMNPLLWRRFWRKGGNDEI